MSCNGTGSDHLRATAASWDRRFESGWFEGKPSTSLMAFVARRRDQIGTRVLDLGCGRGRNLVPLVQQGLEVVGLDLSARGLSIARQRLSRANLSAELVQGGTSSLPFGCDRFDFVFSIGVIHYNRWNGILESFAEVKRVLRPRGLFFFTGRSIHDTTHPRQPIEDHGLTAVDLEGSNRGVVRHYFTAEELIELAGEQDLEIVNGPRERLRPKQGAPRRVLGRWRVVFRKN